MIWLGELISENSKILSNELRSEMLSPYVKFDSKTHYGLGVYVDELDGKKHIWHSGMVYGYLTHVLSLIHI